MKVAYVSCEDPQDVHAWSGLVYHIGHSLEPHAEVSYAGPLAHRRFLADKLRQVVCERVSGKRHRRGREPWLLKHYAEQARPKVAADVDAVLACSTLPVAYLECAQPVVVWIDSTFAGLVDYHPEFHKLCAHTLAMGNAAEQRALQRCRRVIFASEWAARAAMQHYRLDEQKVEVVPFGANLETAPGTAEVRAAVRGRSRSACRLLLVGVDWRRKGADVAVEVAKELRAAGVPAELTIAGCQAPAGTAVPEWVRVTGFISQKSEEGQALTGGVVSRGPLPAASHGGGVLRVGGGGGKCVWRAGGGQQDRRDSDQRGRRERSADRPGTVRGGRRGVCRVALEERGALCGAGGKFAPGI